MVSHIIIIQDIMFFFILRIRKCCFELQNLWTGTVIYIFTEGDFNTVDENWKYTKTLLFIPHQYKDPFTVLSVLYCTLTRRSESEVLLTVLTTANIDIYIYTICSTFVLSLICVFLDTVLRAVCMYDSRRRFPVRNTELQ